MVFIRILTGHRYSLKKWLQLVYHFKDFSKNFKKIHLASHLKTKSLFPRERKIVQNAQEPVRNCLPAPELGNLLHNIPGYGI